MTTGCPACPEDLRCICDPCLGCGRQASCAVIAETKDGSRWLDLCWGCFREVRKANA